MTASLHDLYYTQNTINDLLTTKFGDHNESMMKITHVKNEATFTRFYDTSEPRVKVMFFTSLRNGDVANLIVSVAIEEEDRKGLFFSLGDRISNTDFHKKISDKLSKSSVRTELESVERLLAYAEELTQVLESP